MINKDSILLARMDERQIHQGKTIDKVLTQLTLVNGRLGVVEKWKARLHGAWYALIATATVCGIVIGWGLKYYFA